MIPGLAIAAPPSTYIDDTRHTMLELALSHMAQCITTACDTMRKLRHKWFIA